MANELKATVVNMKSLSQDIDDPVVIGAGDANGRSLRVIFTQEAAAQFTPSTKVYLSWYHQEKKIKGYNIFTEIKDEDDEDFPPTWEIHYPQSMLWEGNVLACIQLVDEVSISTSTNFMIHILSNPNEGADYLASDDYSDFKKMIIRISCLEKQMKDQMESQKIEFEDMQLEFQRVYLFAATANENAERAKEIAENALEVTTTYADSIENIREIAQEANEKAENAENIAEEAKEIASQAVDYTEQIEAALAEAKEYTDDSLTIYEF